MALVWADRVADTSVTTGSSNVTVSGTPPAGFQTFSAVCSSGATFYGGIADQSGSDWEVGLYSYNGSNTVGRVQITESSNSGSAVNFPAGTKNVWMGLPAAVIAAFPQTIRGVLSISMASGTTSYTISNAAITTSSMLKLLPQSQQAASVLPQLWSPASTGGFCVIYYVNDGSTNSYPYAYEISL